MQIEDNTKQACLFLLLRCSLSYCLISLISPISPISPNSLAPYKESGHIPPRERIWPDFFTFSSSCCLPEIQPLVCRYKHLVGRLHAKGVIPH